MFNAVFDAFPIIIQQFLVFLEDNKKGSEKNVFHGYREETKSRKCRTIKRKLKTGQVRVYGRRMALWKDGNEGSYLRCLSLGFLITRQFLGRAG